jgi:hypothetical protein
MTKWLDHVKAYQTKHKCSYKEALVKAKNSYTRTTKPRTKSSIPKGKKEKVDNKEKDPKMGKAPKMVTTEGECKKCKY